MPRIDFYQTSGDATIFACHLIAKVYRRGHQIYVHTATEVEATQLDEQLWTFRPESFVPHALQSAALAAPIRIGFNQAPEEHQDVLINLSGEIPAFFTRFDRLAEVVPANENNRTTARQHYGFYKEKGYEIQYHDMG